MLSKRCRKLILAHPTWCEPWESHGALKIFINIEFLSSKTLFLNGKLYSYWPRLPFYHRMFIAECSIVNEGSFCLQLGTPVTQISFINELHIQLLASFFLLFFLWVSMLLTTGENEETFIFLQQALWFRKQESWFCQWSVLSFFMHGP